MTHENNRTGNTSFDPGYWISHSQGFQVRSGRHRLGFVQEVIDGGRTLAIRGGFLGRRVALVPVEQVFAVVPREMRIWLTTSPAVRAPRAFTPALSDDLTPAARIGREQPERIAA
jgi:hypothetical protein